MNKAKIQMIGTRGFCSLRKDGKGRHMTIRPLKSTRKYQGEIVGFDTEYTSGKNLLICYQLYYKGKGRLYEIKPREKLTPKKLYRSICGLLGYTPVDILLVTYFSLAELQFLPVASEGINIREYANGSLDVDFEVFQGDQYKACLRVFDLRRWFNGGTLYEAAKSVGLKKMEYDTSKVKRSTLRDEKFRKYSIHDAYLCEETFHRVQRSFTEVADIDIVKAMTPANAAQQMFRKLCVNEEIYNDHDRSREYAMLGSWGGRAEVFRRGKLKGKHTEYDFTSAYPTACLKIKIFPCQGSWKTYKNWNGLRGARGGFFRVRFQYPSDTLYPSLPVTTKHALIFPKEGESYCTLYELQDARSQGAKLEVVEGYYYKTGTTSLFDFMQKAIEQRAASKGAEKLLWKLVANSLTGKFSQARKDVNISEMKWLAGELDTTLDDVMSLTKDEMMSLGCRYAVSLGAVFFPEWYGLITGYCRAALGKMIRSSNAVYCHTDSVWTRGKPSCDNMLPFEKKGSGTVTVIRTRLARIGKAHTAFHSIWKYEAAQELLDNFERNKLAPLKYTKRKPLKYKEAIRAGLPPGKWVTKALKAKTFWCGKRNLLSDGTTLPWDSASDFLLHFPGR